MKGELDLIWFFGRGQAAFGGSVQGATLERADTFWHSSERSTRGNHIRHPVITEKWMYMTVKPPHSGEPSYVMDDRSLLRVATIDRELRKLTAQQCNVLRLYYGPIGCSWHGEHRRGRAFAVYPITPEGHRWAEELRAGGAAGEADTLLNSITVDSHNSTRYEHMSEQADLLIIDAFNGWKRVH